MMIFVCGRCGEVCDLWRRKTGSTVTEYWGCVRTATDHVCLTTCCNTQEYEEYDYSHAESLGYTITREGEILSQAEMVYWGSNAQDHAE